jgi:hypothetical protein
VNAQPGEEPVKPRDWFALGDIAQLTNKAAISASDKASAEPIATVLAACGPCSSRPRSRQRHAPCEAEAEHVKLPDSFGGHWYVLIA